MPFLLALNRQREKTFSQKMREADHLLVIEQERAKRRELAGKKIEDPEVTLPQGRSPQTRDIVGDKIGMSGKTLHPQEGDI
jgi:hypothetical protein